MHQTQQTLIHTHSEDARELLHKVKVQRAGDARCIRPSMGQYSKTLDQMGNERNKVSIPPKTAAGSRRESKRKLERRRRGMGMVVNRTKTQTCGSDYESMQ